MKISRSQLDVLRTIDSLGTATDKEVERRLCRKWSASGVRTRRAELQRARMLKRAGIIWNGSRQTRLWTLSKNGTRTLARAAA